MSSEAPRSLKIVVKVAHKLDFSCETQFSTINYWKLIFRPLKAKLWPLNGLQMSSEAPRSFNIVGKYVINSNHSGKYMYYIYWFEDFMLVFDIELPFLHNRLRTKSKLSSIELIWPIITIFKYLLALKKPKLVERRLTK